LSFTEELHHRGAQDLAQTKRRHDPRPWETGLYWLVWPPSRWSAIRKLPKLASNTPASAWL